MLAFRDLKANQTVFMLNSDTLELNECRVVSNSFPHYDMVAKQSVVDIVIENGGKSATYAMPENDATSSNGAFVFSTTKEGLANAVDAVEARAKRIIESIPHQEELIKKASALKEDINPAYKKEKETEERFNKIEGSVSEMKNSVSKMEKMFSEFMNEFKK